MGLQRFERRLERLVEGGFAQGVPQRPAAGRDRSSPRARAGRRPHARRARHRRAEPVHRAALRRRPRALRRLPRRARRASSPTRRASTRRDEDYHFVGPVEVALVADPTAGAATSRSTPRSSAATAGTTGTLVLPDGRRVAARRRAGAHRPPARLRGAALRLRRCRATTPRCGAATTASAVVDLGSTNGTHGERRRRCRNTLLDDGDVIGVGETAIRYEES